MRAVLVAVAAYVSTTLACGGTPPPEPAHAHAPTQATPPAPPPAPPAPSPASSATAPTQTAPASSLFDKQVKSLKDYVQAFNRHDAKAVAALYGEDAVFLERGEFVSAGVGSIEQSYKEHFDAFPDATTAITRSFHRGTTVVFEYVEGGTNTGPHRAHKPTGKRVGYMGASVLEFSPDGRVKKDTTYYDELTKEVQAGWAPGALAKMKVRPVTPVPAQADPWEIHKVPVEDAPAKTAAAQRSLYASLSKSEKDFLSTLSKDVVLAAYDDPADATGAQQAAALFKDWTKSFSESSVEAAEGWATDGYFVVLGTYSGKHVGTWGPVPATKKAFTSHFLDIAKIGKDDKVERLWSYANNYELLKHLGYRKTEVVAGK